MSLKEQAELGLMGLNAALPNDQPLNTQVTPLAVSNTPYQPNLLDINMSGGNDMNQNQNKPPQGQMQSLMPPNVAGGMPPMMQPPQ